MLDPSAGLDNVTHGGSNNLSGLYYDEPLYEPPVRAASI